ncbi:unnamed protein product [marine sediment metagenome]|uniref:DUF1367 family protein n=1 Tax=marine sediment metagenome TaxID=412755 RepID=X0UQL6_9ZZZZ
MIELYVTRTGGRLVPVSAASEEAIKELVEGEILKVKVSRPRNVGHHQKFFALMKIVFENQSHYTNIEHMRKVLTMRAGYYDAVVTSKGTIYLPKSISFAAMDQSEFQDFYERILDVCVIEIGVDQEQLMKEIESFL